MKVPFYGHSLQYNEIKDEIDANMKEVIQSGSFVDGQVALPLQNTTDEISDLRNAIGDKKILLASPEHAAEFC